ncbi:ATP-binding protein [Pseudomonas spirodelae]|uniref:ATP-binding protein n=1 Tax=Pseudomonas spirodelae TaxID=3101751 RepID=A0ABU5PC19_9PSED|nr:ATP-binding protein [Pseudomonas sp. T5W1]MEA1607234.1 ATP-binding protein [Pseudomonas sp. T5W1]
MKRDPTFIGVVQDVFGSTVTVELNDDTATGLGFVAGEGYRIGQVGSFVRIPLGFVDLYGVVSQVGAGAAPDSGDERRAYGNRWIKVQMVGEGQRGGRFERGISQHPTVDDRVHVVTQADLAAIYGAVDPQDYVPIGHLASAEAIPALVNINRLVSRHSAVVGTTGSGKSTTVAGLLNALSDPSRYPAARILVLDIHGEYAKALSGRSTVFRVAADSVQGQKPLNIPFWALSFDEFVPFAFGRLNDAQATAVADAIVDLKREALVNHPRAGVTVDDVTADTPIPFCIHKLWFDLHRREHHTLIPRPGAAAGEVEHAYVLDNLGQPQEPGDAMTVRPPLYRTVKVTGPAEERVQLGAGTIGIRAQLASLASKLRDPRLAFLFRPGDWSPSLDGGVVKDVDELLCDWIGSDQPVSILDLSGIPSNILSDLIGAMLRVLYDAIFWARNLPEGGRERPLLIVLEEAHAYLSRESDGSASSVVRRIAKEGRKYGVGMMLVSQRPAEIDTTILSQCGTLFALRLTNDSDRGHIASAAADNLKGLFEMLPVLRTGEAIVVGEAVSLPIRALISPPPIGQRPDSVDPKVVVRQVNDLGVQVFEGPGGWAQEVGVSDYSALVRQWRKQSPRYEHEPVAMLAPQGNAAAEPADD